MYFGFREQRLKLLLFPLLFISITYFVLVSTLYLHHRQYTHFVWVSLGPIFCIGLISLMRSSLSKRLRSAVVVGFSGVLAVHMVFGVEGVVELVRMDKEDLRKSYSVFNVHEKVVPPPPWPAEKLPESKQIRAYWDLYPCGPQRPEWLIKEVGPIPPPC